MAMDLAQKARCSTSPRPWVGCVVESIDGQIFEGYTQGRSGAHAEKAALDKAGPKTKGAVLFTTLEPCVHQGKTPPCTDAIISAGIKKVFAGILDPDPKVSGLGIKELEAAGIDVKFGVCAQEVTQQLEPYLFQRTHSRPYVVLKLAASLDGRIAAPDGTSQWITGDLARQDAHKLRAESDVILVGANTLRQDDPSLTARDFPPEMLPKEIKPEDIQPLRAVLGKAPKDASAQPLLELAGEPTEILKQLYELGAVQVLIEGGSHAAKEFHKAGLVNSYVFYIAPALFGGDDAKPVFTGSAVSDISQLWRGKIKKIVQLGPDIKVEMVPASQEITSA